MRECAIGPLQSSNGRLATSKEEISEELRKTFFLGHHLKGRSFDEDHYVEVTRRVRNQDPQWRNLTTSAFKVFNEDGERVNLGMTVGDLKLVDGSVLTLQRQQSGGLQNKPDGPLWLVLFVHSAVHCFNLPTFDGHLRENYDSYCHSQLLHLIFWMFISILTEMMKVLKWACKSPIRRIQCWRACPGVESSGKEKVKNLLVKCWYWAKQRFFFKLKFCLFIATGYCTRTHISCVHHIINAETVFRSMFHWLVCPNRESSSQRIWQEGETLLRGKRSRKHHSKILDSGTATSQIGRCRPSLRWRALLGGFHILPHECNGSWIRPLPSQWRYRGLQWQNRWQSSDVSGIRPGPTRTPIRENWPSSVRKSYRKRFLGGKSQTNKPCRTSCRRLDLGSAIERLTTCIFAQWVPHAGQMETRPQLVPREGHLRLMS